MVDHKHIFGGSGFCMWCGVGRPLSSEERAELAWFLVDDFVGSEDRYWWLVERYNSWWKRKE